ncbi:MAG TPA: DUF1569 domain-containing protein [Chitinophagaceae bacterium]|jgi:oxepin-CoA hydrolase/3-oxo-5,6-dehydrosuberyl-CoA semialdehyde dehydrogenase
MLNEQKRRFLQQDFIKVIRNIDAGTKPAWGRMNAQQMVEHLAAFFRISTGKLNFPLVTPPEHLPKYREFLMSEKDFRENTKAPVLPEEPLPLQFPSMDRAVDNLDEEVSSFFDYFSEPGASKTQHPVFGDLDFPEWVQLHHKHVKHHLRQFGQHIQD